MGWMVFRRMQTLSCIDFMGYTRRTRSSASAVVTAPSDVSRGCTHVANAQCWWSWDDDGGGATVVDATMAGRFSIGVVICRIGETRLEASEVEDATLPLSVGFRLRRNTTTLFPMAPGMLVARCLRLWLNPRDMLFTKVQYQNTNYKMNLQVYEPFGKLCLLSQVGQTLFHTHVLELFQRFLSFQL